MRVFKNKYQGWLAGVWLLIGRPGPLILAALVLLAGWAALTLYGGMRPSRRELAAVQCAQQLKSLCERYVTDFGAPAASFSDITAAYPDDALPQNPYTGAACAELNPGDKPQPGGFSYLLLLWQGRIEGSAVLVYSAAPQSKQCFYNRFFARRKRSCDPDLARGTAEVVWIGGETKTNFEYLSRGLDPETAVNKLRRLFQPATSPGEQPAYTSLEVVTAQEYAAQLEQQTQQQ
jgi:hypothetical protein